MKETLTKFLLRSGVFQCYAGYPYFVSAVEMAIENPWRLSNIRQEIYRPLAARYGVSLSCIEKDIRTIRDVIVRNNGLAILEKMTGQSFYYRNPPFPKEVIQIFAECFRPD